MKTLMRSFLFILVMVMMTGMLCAQQKYQDVIYLKNGGVTRGIIIELVPGQHVKIETASGNVFVYTTQEIDKYVKEPAFRPGRLRVYDYAGLKRGYYGAFGIGTGMSFGRMDGWGRLSVNMISGYRVNNYLAAGIGVGIRVFSEEGLLTPVFGEVRTRFLNKKASPYVSFAGGYSFFLGRNDSNGGWMLNPSMGISVKMVNNLAVDLGFSYERQGIKFLSGDGDYYRFRESTKSTDYTHNITFQAGLSF